MNALQETIDFCAAETGRRDVLPVPRALVQLMGSAEGAIFVAQLLAWMATDAGETGWVTRSFKEWEAATALSTYRVRAAVRLGRKLGFVEARSGALAEKRRYRVLQAPLLRALAASLRGEDSAPQPVKPEPQAWRDAPSRQPARQWDEHHRQSPPPANGHSTGPELVQKNRNVGNVGNLGNLGNLGNHAAPLRKPAAVPLPEPIFDARRWQAAQAELARKLPPHLYRRVLRDSHFAGLEGQTVILRVPTVNAAWWLNARLTRPVERAINLVAPGKAWLTMEARL